jgi:hypothetical protein
MSRFQLTAPGTGKMPAQDHKRKITSAKINRARRELTPD